MARMRLEYPCEAKFSLDLMPHWHKNGVTPEDVFVSIAWKYVSRNGGPLSPRNAVKQYTAIILSYSEIGDQALLMYYLRNSDEPNTKLVKNYEHPAYSNDG